MSHRIAVSLFALGLCSAGTAALAAPRTYVASYGNDANAATNCSPTAPCRTFTAAMPVVDAGGQIIVLDSAGYGAITITKSLSIIAPDGVYAGLTTASGNVVNVSGAGIDVTLKGLTITGGTNGIVMNIGSSLNVENCEIAGSVYGIQVEAAAKVDVSQSVIRDNTTGLMAGAGAIVHVMNSRLINNSRESLLLRGGTSETTTINISDTVVSGTSSSFCVDNYANTGTIGIINATRTTVTGCSRGFLNEAQGTGIMNISDSMAAGNLYGIRNFTATSSLTVSNSTVVGNGVGISQFNGTFESLGNNHVSRNSTNTAGVITTTSPL